MKIITSDTHGAARLTIEVAGTREAGLAAAKFLDRQYAAGRVLFYAEVTDDASDDLVEAVFPTCEHGMSQSLCMGPDHFPSREQELAWER